MEDAVSYLALVIEFIKDDKEHTIMDLLRKKAISRANGNIKLAQCLSALDLVLLGVVRIIVLCGLLMGLLSALLSMHELAELVNIGTLFAFITVCLGVIILHYRQPNLHRPFKTPLMPYTPILGILSCLYLILHLPGISMLRFVIWMFLGLIVYGFYSRFNSKLN